MGELIDKVADVLEVKILYRQGITPTRDAALDIARAFIEVVNSHRAQDPASLPTAAASCRFSRRDSGSLVTARHPGPIVQRWTSR